nr:MAG: putative coat protein [Betanecrovirus sp.]
MAKKSGTTVRRKVRAQRPTFSQVNKQVSVPSAMGNISRNIPMKVRNNGGVLTVSHCEPFTTVSLTALGVLSYVTLPLIPSFVPWLNGLAGNFGKWRWTRLKVYYVPSCPTTTQGEMALGYYYDEQDAIAASLIQVASMDKGVTFAPWMGGPSNGTDSVNLVSVPSQFDKPRYIYLGNAAFTALTSTDKNQYCPIVLAIASQGSTAAVPIAGRIWVDYTVELFDPIVAGINT